MKKPYIRTIIGSSGRDCILILFQPYSSKAGIFESNLLRVGHYDLPSTFVLEAELIQD